jgi:LPXTG-motif cell wall-anchored protein
VPSSLASAAGDQSSLPLILAVAAITAIAAGFVVRRRRSILDG